MVMAKSGYRTNMEKLVIDAANKYDKACYISFSDPYHIVVEMLENAKVGQEKFIIIDASTDAKESQTISRTTYIVPVKDLFKVYLFLRNLIKEEGIQMMLLDSISALIYKYSELPLEQMLTDLLLEIGAFRCNSSIVVFDEHANHNVVTHLNPFIAKSVYLY